MKGPGLDGLLVIDKPGGMTSRAALDRALGWFARGTRAGHTGTLDPLATGVLVLCLGAATRLAEYVQRMRKTYRAGIVLGARSDTDDADGTITPAPDASPPDEAAVRAALTGFVGELAQVPPAFSAAKVAGRRSYDLARRGEDVDLKPRTVSVYGIDVLGYAYPRLEVRVECGKGTYIRSLARDLGEQLGCGGYIETLRRTRVGCFDEMQAIPLDAPTEVARAGLQPVGRALAELPTLSVSPEDERRLRMGQAVGVRGFGDGAEVAIVAEATRLVGVGAVDAERGVMRGVKILASWP